MSGLTGLLGKIFGSVKCSRRHGLERANIDDVSAAASMPGDAEPFLWDVFATEKNVKVWRTLVGQLPNGKVFEASEFLTNAGDQTAKGTLEKTGCLGGVVTVLGVHRERHFSLGFSGDGLVNVLFTFAWAAGRAVPRLASDWG
ncbi:hypothetical protein ES708_25213 [subsurface metagenome]